MDDLKKELDSSLKEELALNAITCAVIIVGRRRGLNPIQQSDMWTPWGNAPESIEEEAFQDLVWFHKVLPPHAEYNPELAKRGYYTKLRWQKKDEFWSQYDPEQDKQINYRQTYKPREYPVKNKPIKKLQVKPPTFRCRGQANV